MAEAPLRRKLRVSGHRIEPLAVDVVGSHVEVSGTGDLEVVSSPRPTLTALL